jgi:hypothetical protein
VICYLDIETNSREIYEAEIIEAFFLLENGAEYHFKSQIDNWSFEAQGIHKIEQQTMLSYPSKKEAYRSLLIWIGQFDITEFICFANPNTVNGFMHYDLAVIKVQLEQIAETHTLFYKYFNDNVTSVHTLARAAAREHLFIPIRKRSETGKMVQQLNQSDTYYALFNKRFDNAHSAKSDTMAMIEIYKELLRLKNANRDLFG